MCCWLIVVWSQVLFAASTQFRSTRMLQFDTQEHCSYVQALCVVLSSNPLRMLQRLHYVHHVSILEDCRLCSQIQYKIVVMSNLQHHAALSKKFSWTWTCSGGKVEKNWTIGGLRVHGEGSVVVLRFVANI